MFTPDGTYSAFGSTYTLARFPELVDAAPKGLFMTRHVAGEPRRSTPTRRRARSHCASSSTPSTTCASATSDDTYVRTADGWRLKTRAMTFIRRSGDHDSGRPMRSAGPRPDDRACRDIPTTCRVPVADLVAWLDENDLTPPPGDHSLDAHHAQHSRVLSALYDAGWMRYGWPDRGRRTAVGRRSCGPSSAKRSSAVASTSLDRIRCSKC